MCRDSIPPNTWNKLIILILNIQKKKKSWYLTSPSPAPLTPDVPQLLAMEVALETGDYSFVLLQTFIFRVMFLTYAEENRGWGGKQALGQNQVPSHY